MPASDDYLHWIAQSVNEALENARKTDDPKEKHLEIGLAKRYLSKLDEVVTCMYCWEVLKKDKPYHNHFKGFVHDECSEKYSGRMDYCRKNGIEDEL